MGEQVANLGQELISTDGPDGDIATSRTLPYLSCSAFSLIIVEGWILRNEIHVETFEHHDDCVWHGLVSRDIPCHDG